MRIGSNAPKRIYVRSAWRKDQWSFGKDLLKGRDKIQVFRLYVHIFFACEDYEKNQDIASLSKKLGYRRIAITKNHLESIKKKSIQREQVGFMICSIFHRVP